MTLTWLLLRRHRLAVGSWLVLLTGLSGGTVPAYQHTYATDQERQAVVRLARNNAASTLLYGRLPDPGAPAQLFVWEAGAIVTILAAVMAVLITVSLTRTAEDDGSLELVRSCGVAPRQPLSSALTLITGIAAVLTAGCGVGVGLAAGRVDGITWPGSIAFGAVVGLTFLLVGTLTAVLSQVAASAGQARLLGSAAVGFSFALRVVADARRIGSLNWLSPLGLRATIAPFTADRWSAVIPAVAVTGVLAGLAAVLSSRREFGAGLIRRVDIRVSRLRLRTATGLAVRLGRASLLIWTTAVAILGALFSSIGSGTVEQSRSGDLGGFLGSQLGTGDAAAAYLAYSSTVVGIVVAAFATLSTVASARAERAGLTDLILTTGLRRWSPAAAQLTVTAGGCALILVATGVLSALITPITVPGDDVAVRALAYTIGQWPAAVAAAGSATLIIGIGPRLAGLAWLPLIASALLALLGNLLDVPQRVQSLGFFRHVPDIAGPDPQPWALALLVALGVTLALLGIAASTRRDIVRE